jgi:RNA polymerase sigma-54 factor
MRQDLIQKQENRLIMTHIMRRSLYILELPILELKPYIQIEIEKNPLLEIIEKKTDIKLKKETLEDIDFDKLNLQNFEKSHLDYFFPKDPSYEKKCIIKEKKSFFDHLMLQAKDEFNKENLKIAQEIIGNLDEKGYFTIPIEELSFILNTSKETIERVLEIIKTFDPQGVCAKNLQECLLLQAKDPLVFNTLKNHFTELLKNQLSQISKKLKISPLALQHVLKEISRMYFSPRSQFEDFDSSIIIPDIFLKKEGKNWIIEINEKDLPRFQINETYKKLLPTLKAIEEKNFIKDNLTSANLLIKSLLKRRSTLKNIATYILKKQLSYFKEDVLIPMSIKEVSQALNLHESTVARAISNKYIDCPKGLLPLKAFFSSSIKTQQGEVCKSSAMSILKNLVTGEDKKKPFSDKELSQKMLNKGFFIKRRTITKYRRKMKIGSCYQRKGLI